MDKIGQLRRVCNEIDSLCARIRRRSLNPPAEAADAKLNTAMMTALTSAGSRVKAYRNFFVTHADASGRIGFKDRDGYFDSFVLLSDAAMDLHKLAHVKIACAVEEQKTPGKLSPMFQKIAANELQTIAGLTQSLRELWREDIPALGALKEEQQREKAKTREKPALRLVSKPPAPVSD